MSAYSGRQTNSHGKADDGGPKGTPKYGGNKGVAKLRKQLQRERAEERQAMPMELDYFGRKRRVGRKLDR